MLTRSALSCRGLSSLSVLVTHRRLSVLASLVLGEESERKNSGPARFPSLPALPFGRVVFTTVIKELGVLEHLEHLPRNAQTSLSQVKLRMLLNPGNFT